jgi:hypothetical protein
MGMNMPTQAGEYCHNRCSIQRASGFISESIVKNSHTKMFFPCMELGLRSGPDSPCSSGSTLLPCKTVVFPW